MAKKTGVQQLQTEINNDDELERFLEDYPKALIVLDVYTEWSGPCISLINALRKAKLEFGGDKLQLAICKSDYITKLRRFRKRSEPIWLFIRNSKSVNLMVGSDMPKLMQLIKIELEMLKRPLSERICFEIDELQQEEKKQEDLKNENLRKLEEIKLQKREKKRRDYLMRCTDMILENLPGTGVSIFGPQVSRDMFKKITETAEGLKMLCKERLFQYVTREDFETVNFACANPLSNDIIEELTKQEILLCYWKITDETKKDSVPHVLRQYEHELTKKRVEPPDEYTSQEVVMKPILEPLKIRIEYEVEDYVKCPTVEAEPPKRQQPVTRKVQEEEIAELIEDAEEEEDEGEDHEPQTPPNIEIPNLDITVDALDFDDSVEEAEEEIFELEDLPTKKTCTKTLTIPPVWVPHDARTHAALIYTFFRKQTLNFLPPDPPPEPPVVIMAFKTHKKHELVKVAELHRAKIPYYGFFTSDDADEAKFLTNSIQEYSKLETSPKDKIVFKVEKQTSHMMLSLAAYGATYVSPNTNIGKIEADKFFPEGYMYHGEEKHDDRGSKKEEYVEEKEEFKPENEHELEKEGEAFDIEEIGENAQTAEIAENVETTEAVEEELAGETTETVQETVEVPAPVEVEDVLQEGFKVETDQADKEE